MKTAILNALRPIDAQLERYLARAGLLHYAFYENLFVRKIKRTDDRTHSPFLMSNIPIGPVAYAALGTSAVHVAGTLYVSEIYVPRTKLVTGIGVLNGVTVGTDNLIVALYNATGVRLAHSALAGVVSAGANAFQQIPFTRPLDLDSDEKYHIVLQCNGVTATTRRIAASTYLNRASTIAGSFGTIPGAIAVPATIVADAGPIAYLY
ncbi:MAG: hypothetical protein OEW90_00895 [Betaproteobacteria bacterium]|nr:hypothetical protein [Betaproteobacteria bacterium]MDH4322674.1 hypothetical protein [Betaproteobacteria bacterium]